MGVPDIGGNGHRGYRPVGGTGRSGRRSVSSASISWDHAMFKARLKCAVLRKPQRAATPTKAAPCTEDERLI
ncbi:hypothetical protein [Streptomyces sp. NPDC050287]|uniref:hypothetical protein n=1 Tax=Streptomyces sp. NPDC050287 TaxID=3365608 RepID=UPI0037A3A289